MPELMIRNSIHVNAPASTLWRVLTENQFIPQYMFGCTAETDWRPGSPLLWKGVADGKLYVKGHVVATQPPMRLEYTVIDPNNPEIPDVPENYLTVAYLLSRSGNGCTLEITQGDFAKVAKGESRYRESQDPNNTILVAIKKLAEEEAKARR